MASSLTAAMQAEMEGRNRVHPVLELTFGGVEYLFAEEAVASASQGVYQPFIVADSWSGFGRYAEDTLEIPEAKVTVFDKNRALQKESGGPSKSSTRGGTAKAYYRSEHVAAADHYLFFDGVVTDFEAAGDREYTFTMSPDTRVLKGLPKIPFLTKTDFATAPAAVLNQPLWLVFGRLSSSGVPGATGMVKCLPATEDENGDSIDWICAAHQLTIQKLFFDGTENTGDWAFYNTQRGARYYQMARYTGGGTKPTPTSDIAIDCEGLRTTAPTETAGGTTAMENPATCIRTFLSHFAYGSGSVLPNVTAYETETGKPIATSVFDAAETFFTGRNDVMAKVIKADEKVIDVVNAWCEDFNALAHWIDTWKFGAIPEDPADDDVFHDDRHVAQKLGHALGPLTKSRARAVPISDVEINYLLNENAGALTETGRCHNPAADETVKESFDFGFGSGRKF